MPPSSGPPKFLFPARSSALLYCAAMAALPGTEIVAVPLSEAILTRLVSDNLINVALGLRDRLDQPQ